MKLKNNLTLYSHPPPGSGVLTAYIMRLLDAGHLVIPATDGLSCGDHPVTYHRIAEAFKHAYAQRTKLGDPRFHPEVNQVRLFFKKEKILLNIFVRFILKLFS